MPLTSSSLLTPFLTGGADISVPVPITPTLGGPVFLPAPVGPKIYKQVIHYAHDGTALGDEFPSNLTFALYLGKVGFIQYDLDRSSPLAKKDTCEPYATDYALFIGDRKIQAGVHTDIEATDMEGHTFQISGKDWYHWFEGQRWFFDPTNPLANVFTRAGVDIFTIFEDMLDNIQAYPNTIQFTYDNGLAGVTTNFKIDANDTEDMLQKFTTFSQATPAFDFEITPDKEINLYYPKKTRINPIVLEVGANIYNINYHNKGPTATELLITGKLPSSNAGIVITDLGARTKYRRWMGNTDIGDTADQSTLVSKSGDFLDHTITPSLEFTCTVIPDFVEEFFANFDIGDSIHVHGDIGWAEDVHELSDPYFRLVSISGTINDEGDEEYELGFDDGTISL